MHPRALTPGAPGRRSPGEGLPGRQQCVSLIWEPQQLVDCGASPARLPRASCHTDSRAPGGPAGHMLSALCPLESWGRGEGNKSELLGELQRYTLVIKKSFQVSH